MFLPLSVNLTQKWLKVFPFFFIFYVEWMLPKPFLHVPSIFKHAGIFSWKQPNSLHLPLIWCFSISFHSLCKMMILERKCTDRAVRLRSTLESHLSTGMSSSDVWDKTVSFFTVKKAFIFHNGYTKSSREAMRAVPLTFWGCVAFVLPVRSAPKEGWNTKRKTKSRHFYKLFSPNVFLSTNGGKDGSSH